MLPCSITGTRSIHVNQICELARVHALYHIYLFYCSAQSSKLFMMWLIFLLGHFLLIRVQAIQIWNQRSLLRMYVVLFISCYLICKFKLMFWYTVIVFCYYTFVDLQPLPILFCPFCCVCFLCILWLCLLLSYSCSCVFSNNSLFHFRASWVGREQVAECVSSLTIQYHLSRIHTWRDLSDIALMLWAG